MTLSVRRGNVKDVGANIELEIGSWINRIRAPRPIAVLLCRSLSSVAVMADGASLFLLLVKGPPSFSSRRLHQGQRLLLIPTVLIVFALSPEGAVAKKPTSLFLDLLVWTHYGYHRISILLYGRLLAASRLLAGERGRVRVFAL